VLARSADLRYKGQGFELRVDWSRDVAARFHRLHAQSYGYADPERTVEIVTLRVQAVVRGRNRRAAPAPLKHGDGRDAVIGEDRVFEEGRWRRAALFERSRLHPGSRFRGPAVISELTATTYVPGGWVVQVDGHGNLVLTPYAGMRTRGGGPR
jgi:N-methylhydantoinase A